MPAPTYTAASSATITVASIAASGVNTPGSSIDLSTVFEGQIIFEATFGTVAVTAGVQVQLFSNKNGSATTNAKFTYIIGAVGSTTQSLADIPLGTGKLWPKFTNLDATNAVTNVNVWINTVPTVV